MRYIPRVYAAALVDALRAVGESERASCIARFVRVLAKNGDLVRADAVTEEFEKIVSRENGGHFITLEFARAIDHAKEAELTSVFSDKDIFKRSITPSLVAGVRVTIDGDRELDVSLRGRLTQLFRI